MFISTWDLFQGTVAVDLSNLGGHNCLDMSSGNDVIFLNLPNEDGNQLLLLSTSGRQQVKLTHPAAAPLVIRTSTGILKPEDVLKRVAYPHSVKMFSLDHSHPVTIFNNQPSDGNNIGLLALGHSHRAARDGDDAVKGNYILKNWFTHPEARTMLFLDRQGKVDARCLLGCEPSTIFNVGQDRKRIRRRRTLNRDFNRFASIARPVLVPSTRPLPSLDHGDGTSSQQAGRTWRVTPAPVNETLALSWYVLGMLQKSQRRRERIAADTSAGWLESLELKVKNAIQKIW